MKQLFLSFALLGILSSCKSDKKDEEEKNYQVNVPEEEKKEKAALEESILRGKTVYADLCVTCHLPGGQGIPGTYPPLDGSNWLSEKREESIAAVKFGLSGPIKVNSKEYDNIMTPMGLSDREVADAMNFIMNSWSNNISPRVTVEEVRNIKKK